MQTHLTKSNPVHTRGRTTRLSRLFYKSAWLLCAKLRRAMVAPDRSPLQGVVEVDETTIPYRRNDPPAGGRGRRHDGKMLVAGAVEIGGRAPGRVRLAAIADGSAATLHAFIAANVSAGATVKTDGWPAYQGAPGVSHEPHVVGSVAAHLVLPWTHRHSPTSNAGRSASTTACFAASTCNPTSTNSCSASIAAKPARRLPLAARHRRHHQKLSLQNADLTGSNGISLPDYA